MSRIKQYTRLKDINTGEVMVSAEFTPATIKRLIKQYAVFGHYLIQF